MRRKIVDLNAVEYLFTNNFTRLARKPERIVAASIRRIAAAAIIAGAAIGVARAADLSDAPILRIETGMHGVRVSRLAVTPDGKLLVSGSYDHTLRLWSLPDLAPIRTIRLPSDDKDEGWVYGVAVTPDGKTIAASGWTSNPAGSDTWCLYLFAVATGAMERRLCDLPHRVNDLAYSPDGRYLAAVMKAGRGLRVYRSADYSLAAEDRDYGDDAMTVEFDAAGRLLTSAMDGKVRLYDAAFHRVKSAAMPERRLPFSASFSPDGSQIAVGYSEHTMAGTRVDDQAPDLPAAVDVISGSDLTPLFRPDLRGVDNGVLSRVGWSADGKFLYAGGTYQKRGRNVLRRWNDGGKGRPQETITAPERFLDIRPISGGGMAFAGNAPYIGVVNADGKLAAERAAPVFDYHNLGDRFAISADGLTVQFAGAGGKTVTFSLADETLKMDAVPNKDFASAILEAPRLDIRDWDHQFHPTLNGTPLKLLLYEHAFSMAIAPDQKSFLLGTSWHLRHYDAAGNVLWFTVAPGSVRDITVTPDGRLAVTAQDDGTIRWYAMDTGRELLALFPHRDGEHWVAWTPSGYYMSSVGGDTLIGWQVNQGRDKAADFFTVGRFSGKYYRPDIVTRVLATLDEPEAIKRADAEGGRHEGARGVAGLLPPVIEILDPAPGRKLSESKITVRYRLHAPSGEPVTSIIARVNGHRRGEYEAPKLGANGEAVGELQLTLPQADADLQLSASNRFATSEPADVRLVWAGARSDLMDTKRKVYVLAVGVGRYADPALKLTFPAKDAQDFIAALERQKGKAYSDVVAKVILDDQATLAAVRDGIAWLAKSAGDFDLAVVYLAGHGFDDQEGVYHFLPADARLAQLDATALSRDELLSSLEKMDGDRVLFLDTCHAGNAVGGVSHPSSDVNHLVSELGKPEHALVVYAAAAGGQFAHEDPALKNGYFTRAVVDGLDGGADFMHRSYVTTSMLEVYVKERVKDLSGGAQTPTFNMPSAISDLLLARVSASGAATPPQ